MKSVCLTLAATVSTSAAAHTANGPGALLHSFGDTAIAVAMVVGLLVVLRWAIRKAD